MKKSPPATRPFTLATTSAGNLSLAVCIALASQGAWSATCPTRPACNVSQNNFSGNLVAGQSLCISGTYTGDINNLGAGATIYVPAGATFNPASLQNPAGSIINCGTATLPSITLNAGFNFSNHGTADFRSNINWNGSGTFFNDAGAKISLRTSFQMKGSSKFTNDGEILSSGDFSTESGTSIINTGYIRLSGGNFNPDGVVVNSGFVQTDEFININPNSELINNCSFISQKGFNNNSPKTRNNGYIIVTGVGNNNDLVQNNKPFTQGPNAVVVGKNFINNGAISGGGKYYFTGDTRNQAPFGDDGGGINFYDTTRTTSTIFDAQSPTPHSSVTSSAFTPPKVDAVVPSCSKNVAPVKPVITINIIAGDDIINTLEDDSQVPISGVTTDAPNGSSVSLVINGKNYSGSVSNNGWSIMVPAADAQLFDPTEQVEATVTLPDNSASSEKATRAVTHATELPKISIDVVAIDDIINAQEDDLAVVIKGTTIGAENNSTVSVQINNKKYSATVQNNSWSFDLPALDAQALKPDEIITATVTNKAGNVSLPANRPIKHSTTLPTISIGVVAEDDIINATEDDKAVTIIGATVGAQNNSQVSAQLNGKVYTATVTNNAWSFILPAADAQALPLDAQISATVTNTDGNISTLAIRPIKHKNILPGITIGLVAGDDIINTQEDDAPVTIKGTTSGAENNSIVYVQLNGKSYTATVNNNNWSFDLSAADAQALKANEIITATVTDAAGNVSVPANRPISHSLITPTITLKPIAGDDTINLSEDDAAVVISGTTTQVENGQKVTLAINGKTYTATVNDNSWTTSISAADAQILDASELVDANVRNNAGDTAQTNRTIKHSQGEPSVDIEIIAGDDIINTEEDNNSVLISGTTDLVENNQKVSITLNGKNYTGTVNNDRWQISVPAADAQALDATERVTATATNLAGDKSEPASRDIQHSLSNPTVTINVIAGDDIINASEDDSPVTVSGKTTLVEDGAKVSVSVNGKTYEAIVTNNTWSISMPAADAQALGASEKVTASVTNKAGDKATTDRTVTHSGTTPTVTINVIAVDDIINLSEDDLPVVISGKTTLVEDGQKVGLIINGKNYEAAVSNNTWTTSLPAVDAQALKASEKVVASVSNKAGDKAEGDRTVTHSLTAPTVIINVIAGDDIINASEDDSPVTVSGKTTLVEDGAKVSVSVNGKTYEAIVTNNTWSISMPAADAQALGASDKVTASVTNKAGDKATGDRTITHSGTTPTVTINVIAVDDIINLSEDDLPVVISGKTTLVEDGQKVSLIINGKNYEAVVTNNTWTTSIPALDAQALKASEKVVASVSNKAGDKAEGDRTVTHSLTAPTVTINVIAGDDIINASEDDSPVTVSGKTTLAEDGAKVSVSVNGKTYEAIVTNNTWAISMPAADAQALGASEKVTASVTNKAGDKATVDRTVTHSGTTPTVTINVIAGDDIINLSEDDLPVAISGKTTLVEDGQKVSLIINGKNYEAVVTNNTWTTSLPAVDAQALKASEKVVASVSNKAGDKAEGDRTVTHSLTAPTVTINVIAGDDIINASEDDSPVTVSGKTTLVEDGAKVSVSVNGKTYEAIVTNNTWSISMPAADAQALGASEKVTASVTNKAGDKATVDRTVTHSGTTPTVTINVIAVDDIINLSEDDLPVVISGKTTLVEDGQKVGLIINGKNYEAVVTNNTWTTSLPAVDAQALKASEKVVASVSNKAGDKATVDRTVTHSGTTPTVTINVIAGDDIINLSEDDLPVAISGKTTLAEDGQKVSLIINGKNYEAVVTNNTWATSLPAVDAQALKASEKVVASVSNKAGDKAEGDRTVTHSLTAPTVTINVIAGDDIINASEDDSPVTVSGKTTLVEDGAKVSVSVNGKTYEAIVTNNTWSISMPAADAQALGAAETVTATVTNKAGDKATTDRTVTHSGTTPTVTINVIAVDDIINLSEDDLPVAISGKTTLVEDGQKVSLIINGKNYEAVVTNNTWTTSLPAVDAQALKASEKVVASVSNKAGDKAEGDRTVTHSLTAPTVTINVIAGDDIINASEDDSPVTVSGKTTLVEDGAKVSVTVNGKTYEAIVTNNTWSISMPAADAQALGATETVTATVTNKAGDKATTDRTVTHSGTTPTVTINVIAVDDIINLSEDDLPVVISGKTTLVEDGQKVSLIINGKNYEAVVTNNTWTTSIPALDAQALKASEKVVASVSNKAGDKAEGDRTVTHSLTAPTVIINVIAGDDIINASEDDLPVIVSGKTTLVEDGAKVSVSVNGKTYEAIVTNNTWSISMPAADAQALGAAETVTATVTNKAGDKATVDRTVTHSGTTPTVTINVIAVDDIINLSEDDLPVVISGKTTLVEDGQKVSLIINGKNYEAVVTNNTWTTSIPALDAQALKASEKVVASVSNKAGDKAEGDRTVTHSLAAPTVTINPIAGDDIINASEDDAPVIVSGKTTLVEDGAKVSVTVNGKTYEAIVTNNTWSISMPAADAQALGASEKVTASVTNKAGDKATTDRTVTHSGTTPTVTINVIAVDDIINLSEDDLPVVISGKTTLVEDGQKVGLIINGKNYEAAVSNNTWTTSIPALDAQALKASEKVVASVSNKAGDKAEGDRTVTHSLTAPTVIINVIAGDDIINASEDDVPVTVSGKTTLVEDGAKVSVSVNGKTYEAIVTNNTWSISMPAADAQALGASEKVTASVTNKAGDKATGDRTVTHSGTTPTVTINVIAVDDIINLSEDDLPVVISGKTTLVEDGQKVSLIINGKTYEAAVSNNTWTTSIPALDAQALKASEKVVASVSNKAGDKAEGDRTVTHSLTAPTVIINVIAGDDIINASEDDSPVTVSGKTTLVEDGAKVNVTVNGKTYEAIVTNNTWAISMPAVDAQALGTSEKVTASVTNKAGDKATGDRTVTHSGTTPTVTINVIAVDDIINLSEDDLPVVISGKTTLVEDGQKVSLIINGKTYEAAVSNNTWTTSIPALDAQALKASEKVVASVSNKAGDKAEGDRTVTHSLTAPTVIINVIAGDDIINASEDDSPVTVSGKTTLVEDGAKVSVSVNGKTYEAIVTNNTWSISMPAADAQALGAAETVTATVTNKAGDKATGDRTVTHSGTTPTVTINVIAVDDIINLSEDDLPVVISGKTTLVEDGQKVGLIINGKNYEAVVTNNTWTTSIPALDAQALKASEKVVASVSNKAGDKAEGDRTVTHSLTAPTVTINVIAGDDIINASEDDAPVIVSGKTTLVEDGAKVSVSVNGKTYEAIVTNNTWAISMPAVDAQALGTSEKVTASVTNKAGDKATTDRTVTHSGTTPTVTINVIAVDDIINLSEDDLPVVISGKTTLVEDGQKVSLIINGKNYEAVVTNNTWTTSIPALDAQALKASEKVVASVSNKAGDKAEGDRTVSHSLTAPTVTINPIAGDDIINASEDDLPVTVSGKTTLVEDGAKVSVTVNGKTYEAIVTNNTWSISMPAADAQALGASEKVTAAVTNKAGDKATVDRTVTHSGTTPTVTINVIAGDDIINLSEDDLPVAISGKTTLVEDGQKVSLIINGKNYEAAVSNNTWTTSIPAADAQTLKASEKVSATATNKAGDKADADRTITHSLTQPSISINPVAGDDIINSVEDDAPVIISGKTTLVEDGAQVSVTVNGKTYTAVVSDNAWFVLVPVADVQALDSKETLIATVTNKAGDKAEADKNLSHSVELPTITINPIAVDDIINTQEDDAPVLISGKTSLVENGQLLRLVINGVNYDAPVTDNTWSVILPASDAQALHASEQVTAVVINKAGDKADAVRAINHSTNAPSISINPIAGDDIINAQEDDAAVVISGTTSLVEDGAKIQVLINGKTYEAVVNQNNWQVLIPPADAQALDSSEQITARVTNKAGDLAQAERTVIHSATSPTITIAAIAEDDIINTSEDDIAVAISGTTTKVEDGQTLTLSVNGKQYPAVVSNNSWSVLMPVVDAQALPASNTVSAHVVNLAGDPADADRALTHITVKPRVIIKPIAGDDIINANEDDAPVAVSGTTEGVADGTPLVVTVNGKNYTTSVQNNQWSTSMPALDAQALEQSNNLVAKVTTQAGDKAEDSKLLTHNGSGAAITLAPITGDNLVSSLEDNAPVTIKGTTSGVENGARVTFELNDAQYEALVNNNQWSFELPQAAAEALKPEDTAHAEVSNALGDRAETTAVVHHLAWEDTDGDGLSDDVEDTKQGGTKDTDKDGVPDYKDIDSDNDGLLDEDETRDTSTDNNQNTIPDSVEASITKGADIDNDGIDDRFDAAVPGAPKGVDKNDDGIKDDAPVRDSDGDGLADYVDIDSDNDAVPDLFEVGGSQFDSNGDGRADGKDSDGDGLLDVFDPSQGNQPLVAKDADKDGIADPLDLDADDDGLPDINEDAIGIPDPNGDGIISAGPFVDSDKDGLGDAADINSGGKLGVRVDSDFNGSSDGQSTDRDGDGVTDLEESIGKTPAQQLDPDGDGRIGSSSGGQKPSDGNNNGIPDAGEINLAGAAVKDTNGNGISDGIEEQLGRLHIPVPASNAQNADFDRDGYPDWIEVRYGGNPLDNAEADSNGNGVPNWVESTDILLDNQIDSDADGFADLLEQTQGTSAISRNSSDELFDAALKNLLNPDRYEGRSLKPVIWVDMQQGTQAVASLGNLAADGALNGNAQFSLKIGNYHVFGDPRDPLTVPVYSWVGSSAEVLALADNTQGASLSFDPTRLSPGQYQVTGSVTLAGHTSTSVQRFVVGASAVTDLDRDHLADSQDQQDANLGLLQAVPAQSGQLMQAAAITLVNNAEQLDHALRLRLGAAAQATNAGQALLTPEAFSQYGTAIGNSKYTTQSNATFTYAQVYDLEVTNLPSVGGTAEVVIPLAQPIRANLHLQRFNPLTGWQAFNTTSGDEIATAARDANGLCPAPGSSLYEPGLNGGASCLLVRVSDGGLNDGDNNDGSTEDGQGDVNGLIQLGLTLAQDTPPPPPAPEPAKQGKIQTGLKGHGGSFGWLFLAFTPVLFIFRRRKPHDQAR